MGKGGCRHVINAQCSIFMGDKKTGAWFDCPECYEEVTGKRLDLAIIESPLTLVCKACRQLFQKDLRIFDEDDAVCPHCGNAYVIPAMTPESCLVREAAQLCERAMEEALEGPLDVGNGLAMSSNFEHWWTILNCRRRCVQKRRRTSRSTWAGGRRGRRRSKLCSYSLSARSVASSASSCGNAHDGTEHPSL